MTPNDRRPQPDDAARRARARRTAVAVALVAVAVYAGFMLLGIFGR
jgi:hypothetical protein